jgi:transposase
VGVSSHALYKWLRLFAEPAPKLGCIDHEAENRRLKRRIARVTDERDFLKEATAHFARESR